MKNDVCDDGSFFNYETFRTQRRHPLFSYVYRCGGEVAVGVMIDKRK
jgi:hypothetical protein